MIRLLTTLIITAFGIYSLRAEDWETPEPIPVHDFISDGIYYKILSEEEHTVEVACGNTAPRYFMPEKIAQMIESSPARNAPNYDFMFWQGNSYKGDVVVPEKVKAPDSDNWYTVTQIGMGAFCYCEELTSVTLPHTLRRLEPGAFCRCFPLQELIIPDEVTVVRDYAFVGANNVRHIHFPLGAAYIQAYSFSGTGSPEGFEVTGTENVRHIMENAFWVSKLNKFPTFRTLETIRWEAFSETLIETAEIPAGDPWIETYTFSKCNDLTEVTLHEGLKWPDRMFYDDKNLRLIRFYESTPPEIKIDITTRVSPDCVLEVPAEAVEAYRTAPLWENFKEIRAIGSVGIDAADTGCVISSAKGLVIVKAADDRTVEIYNTAGTCIHRQTGSCRVPVAAGVYVVKAGPKTTKVIVD